METAMTIEVQKETARSIGITDLTATTAEFFDKHWNSASLGTPPVWERWKTFLVGPVPNYQYGGCYALFSESELIYVGLGASRGGGRYPQHGISRRLMANVLRSDSANGPYNSRLREEKYPETTAIWTLGLPSYEYLAAALESFLIRSLSPRRNARV
jgi:hypothetical protein